MFTRYQIVAIKCALKLYIRTGIKVNSAYTITNMLRTATALTGNKYNRNKRTTWSEALVDLENLIEQIKV